MTVNPIDPDKKPSQAQHTFGAGKAESTEPGKTNDTGSLPRAAMLFLTSHQLEMLDSTIDGTGSNYQVKEPLLKDDHSGTISDSMSALVEAVKSKEYLSKPFGFFKKLLKTGIDITQVTKNDIKSLIVNELKSKLSPLFKNNKTIEAVGKAIAQAYMDLTGASKEIKVLKDVLGILMGPKTSLINKIVNLYTDVVELRRPGDQIPGIDESHKIAQDAIENDQGGPIDTGGNIVDAMNDILIALRNKEYKSHPASFFKKLLKVGIDITQVEKEDLKNQLIDELKSKLGTLFENNENLQALGVALAQAYQDLSNFSEDVRQLRDILNLFFDSNTTLCDKIIGMYELSLENKEPIPGIDESHAAAANAIAEGEIGPIDTGGDIVGDMAALAEAIENEEYLSDPTAFYQKLLKVGVDISNIDTSEGKGLDLQKSMIQKLKSTLSVLFKSEEAKEALAIAIAQAYNELSKGSEDIRQLENVLGLLFGSKSAIVGQTIELYINSIKTKEPIAGIDKSYELAGDAIKESRTWENRYEDLINNLKRGKIDFIEMMSLLEEGFDQLDQLDPESAEYKELMEKMAALTKAITPLIDNPSASARFAEMLTLYFAEVGDFEGSEKRVDEFIQKLVPFYVDDLDNYREDVHYQNLYNIGELAKEGMKAPGGPFDPEGAMTQDEIDAQLNGNLVIFNDLVGVAIKNYDILHNKPILMAIYVLLMSSDGAYGHLAGIMSNLNLTMKKIGEIVDVTKDLTNKISDFMEETDPLEMKKIAQDIADLQKDLNEVIEANKDFIGDKVLESLKKFADPGVGTLDDILSKADTGVSSWEELAENEDACKTLQQYLTAAQGGGVGEGTNRLISELSNLQQTLNVQNQGQLEKLNMTTKKVDSLTKLFSSFITMYKGMIQTLTQYSGS